MNLQEIKVHLSEKSIMAVVTIDDIDKSNYVCEALLAGGVNIIELTLRTKNVFNVMNNISKNFSQIIIGAGTVLSKHQVKQAKQSGALFGLAPGLDPETIEEADKFNLPFIPGVCSPSDIQSALRYDLNLLKFFPAEFCGGIDYLKSISAPFVQNDLKFIPLGGISNDSAEKYLNSDLVMAVGGSWIANNYLIENCDWKEIKNRANLICEQIKKTKGN